MTRPVVQLLGITVVAVTTLCALWADAATNRKYDFDACAGDTRRWLRQSVSGAVVTAGAAAPDELPLNCSYTFRSATADEVFLVQMTRVSVRRHANASCVDSLTVVELRSSEPRKSVLLDEFCGTKKQLPVKPQFYTRGRLLKVTWHRAATNQSASPSELSMTLTSVSQHPVVCDVKSHLRCTNDDCIDAELLCDGVEHCRDGEDEFACPNSQKFTDDDVPVLPPPAHPRVTPSAPPHGAEDENSQLFLYMPLLIVVIFTIIVLCLIFAGRKASNMQEEETSSSADSLPTLGNGSILSTVTMVANFTLVTGTTTTQPDTTTTYYRTPVATTPLDLIGWDIGSPDLVSVAIVGSVFAVVLVVCIILGCREKKEQDPEAGLVSSSQTNSNQAFADPHGPPTPPPTYSFIERQTSYVSDISQRSSQISMPPDYDDALDMPDSPSGRRRRESSRRRRSRLSRGSSGGSSRRRRQQAAGGGSRFPFFRSWSAAETLARYRARHSAPVELVATTGAGSGEGGAAGGPRPSQLTSETDTLPSLRENDADTLPSDDNVFESPSSTLETQAQVEAADGEGSAVHSQSARSSPPAPDAHAPPRLPGDASPETERLLSNGNQPECTSGDGDGAKQPDA